MLLQLQPLYYFLFWSIVLFSATKAGISTDAALLGCNSAFSKSVTVLLLSLVEGGFRSTEKLKQFISVKLVGENSPIRDPETTYLRSNSKANVSYGWNVIMKKTPHTKPTKSKFTNLELIMLWGFFFLEVRWFTLVRSMSLVS